MSKCTFLGSLVVAIICVAVSCQVCSAEGISLNYASGAADFITPIDVPGVRARVRSVIVEYEILGGEQSARIKLWGLR